MKKIILTFFVFILSINFAFAEECLVQDKTAPALLEYIKNNQAITKEITNQVWAAQAETSWTITWRLSSMQADFVRTYNKIFIFEWFYSYFKFFAVYPVSNDVPYPVRRDYTLLTREDEWLQKYLENIIRRWKSNVVIKNICSWISSNCNFPAEITANELMGLLLKNNNSILNIYRNTVMWDLTMSEFNLVLVPTNFLDELETYYSPNSYAPCAGKEWWTGFFDRAERQITESMNKITDRQNLSKNWIQKWKDAWNLLLWLDTSTATYQEIEKELLRNKLAKDWIYSDNQSNVLAALEKFNQPDWWFRNSNFIYNTSNNIGKQIGETMYYLKNNELADFLARLFSNNEPANSNTTSEENATVPIATVIRAQQNSTNTILIKERIEKVYQELLNFEANSEINTTNFASKILESHVDIANAIDVLTETCEKSVAVCKKQDPASWDCGRCD